MSDIDNEYTEKQLKVVVVGEPSCGKTCLIARYCSNDFQRQYYPTYGADFSSKRICLQLDIYVRLILWDVSGQALDSNMLDKYLYGANIILLTYDITNTASFNRITDWIGAIRKIRLATSPVFALIANKSDMEHQRAVSVDKLVRLANDNGYSSHTVSARTGENVTVTIQRVCAEYLGLKLSRMEQEANQNIVQAEILSPGPTMPASSHQSTPSSVCCLQ